MQSFSLFLNVSRAMSFCTRLCCNFITGFVNGSQDLSMQVIILNKLNRLFFHAISGILKNPSSSAVDCTVLFLGQDLE